MRLLGALGAVLLAVVAGGTVYGQAKSVGGFGNVVFPASGHAPAGVNPWGNIVSPALPQGAAAFATGNSAMAGSRYGSLVPGFTAGSGNGRGTGSGRRRGGSSGIYAYPVFIGGYGYAPGYDNSQAEGAPANGAAPSQTPVVINQYFGTQPAGDAPAPEAGASNFHYYQPQANEEQAPAGDSTYYLIAFKDHTVYSAVAYYTDGDTLHYFTQGNVHNQVSLSLVDRALTEQLNRPRNVTVRLP